MGQSKGKCMLNAHQINHNRVPRTKRLLQNQKRRLPTKTPKALTKYTHENEHIHTACRDMKFIRYRHAIESDISICKYSTLRICTIIIHLQLTVLSIGIYMLFLLYKYMKVNNYCYCLLRSRLDFNIDMRFCVHTMCVCVCSRCTWANENWIDGKREQEVLGIYKAIHPFWAPILRLHTEIPVATSDKCTYLYTHAISYYAASAQVN